MIGAVVLAAGQSKRMGSPKMILPWGNTTVIGQVVSVLQTAGVGEICVVTGAVHNQVQSALQGMQVITAFNPNFQHDEMAVSLQVGLSNLSALVKAALVVLGDQPQIQEQVVRAIIQAYQTLPARLIVPSFQKRRGHPWLIDRALWPDVMALKPPHTLRDILLDNSERILYIPVETDTILRDLDTPEDYQREIKDKQQ